MRRAAGPVTARDEEGTGVVATTFGFAAFLGFVLVAVQVSVGLYARSSATATGFDATRRLAAAGEACPARQEATAAELRSRLGRYWRVVSVEVECRPTDAVVRLDARSAPSLVPPALRRPMGLERVSRTFTVRLEAPTETPARP